MSLHGLNLAQVLDLINQNYRLFHTIFSTQPGPIAPDLRGPCQQLRDQLRILVDPYIHILLAPPSAYDDNVKHITWNRFAHRLAGVPDVSPFRHCNINPHRHFRLDDMVRRLLREDLRESLPRNSAGNSGLPSWLKQGSPYHPSQSSQHTHIFDSLSRQELSGLDWLSIEANNGFIAYQPANLDAAKNFLQRLKGLGPNPPRHGLLEKMAETEIQVPPPGNCAYCRLISRINIAAATARVKVASGMAPAEHTHNKLDTLRAEFERSWHDLRSAEERAAREYARLPAREPAEVKIRFMLNHLCQFAPRQRPLARQPRPRDENQNENEGAPSRSQRAHDGPRAAALRYWYPRQPLRDITNIQSSGRRRGCWTALSAATSRR